MENHGFPKPRACAALQAPRGTRSSALVHILITLQTLDVQHQHGHGSEVIFTLFRFPEMLEEKYAEHVGLVERDLATLTRLLGN
ncbi:MAG: hypothetical protein A3G24_05390 [Betaproteobacteria bacterium RIFCSPLOWO2_12_FULL_62_13]|nr:MAG: hypothetical protein A3G24_05390 [Betaproteobacteria bacterium RIFCSPLOWO2_12_FULL_62_13]